MLEKYDGKSRSRPWTPQLSVSSDELVGAAEVPVCGTSPTHRRPGTTGRGTALWLPRIQQFRNTIFKSNIYSNQSEKHTQK